MNNKYYITTTLPYVNAAPHIGFAAEIVRADVLARYQRSLGKDVFFNFGTDEHGLKIYQKAEKEGKDVQAYCDEYAVKFDELKEALNLSYNSFVRTTDQHHMAAVQEFWRICRNNGYIYKKNYQVKYCVGCELEITDSELVNGCCPHHSNQEPELIDEENYFFKFSEFQDDLLRLYESNPDFVIPSHRQTEVKNFVASGLQDFSISRLKKKMPWGVPVPDDPEQVVYVWFDALINYISAIGWPDDFEKFNEYWPVIQTAGKDNLRQQSAMWQAMLKSVGLPYSKQILIFGFITVDGQKISKSLGNVIDPIELVEKYGTEAVRYYVLSELSPFEDSDFTFEKFETKYNADLANGLGNLVARVSNLLEKNEIQVDIKSNSDKKLANHVASELKDYNFNEALRVLWEKIKESDEELSAKAPWKMSDKKEINEVLEPIAQNILNVASLLEPFLPETAEKIIKQFSAEQIKKEESLFPRLNN